jgi:hypothetical protein
VNEEGLPELEQVDLELEREKKKAEWVERVAKQESERTNLADELHEIHIATEAVTDLEELD